MVTIRNNLAFYSKKLSPAEVKYFVFDRRFTGHKPLKTVLNSKRERSTRQAQQLDYIGQFTTDKKLISAKLIQNIVQWMNSKYAISMISMNLQTPNNRKINIDPALVTISINLNFPKFVIGYGVNCQIDTSIRMSHIISGNP